MARLAIVLGAALAVGGGALGGYGALSGTSAPVQMTAEQSAAMGAAIERVAGSLRDVRTAARTRAQTLSSSRQLAVALQTDKATVVDMVAGDKGGELAVELRPGEVIEFGIINPDGFEVLVRQPPAAAATGRGGAPASQLAVSQTLAIAYEVAAVRLGTTQLGYVTVAMPADLAPALESLVASGLAGRLELAGAAIDFGGGAGSGATEIKPLSEGGAKLVVAKPQVVTRGSQSMLIVGAGAALVGLGLLALAMLIGRKRSPARDPVDDIRTLPTMPSTPPSDRGGAVAAGTPSPIESTTGGAVGISPLGLSPGAMIGRWEVIRRLGSGGMADVYLAHSKGEAGFEKLVAIKVMHPHLARNQRAVEHFLDEAKLAARIHHPNVVQIQDLGKIGSDYVIVMEYVEGVDLERLLVAARTAERPIPINVGLAILCRICDGLHAAHTATGADGEPLGLIHRDVKSANVLVSKQGTIKVVDFGIAKAAKQSHLTLAGETKGTPSMMAPEQRVGEEVDVRADVYSLAAVGYELLTNRAVNLDLAALAHLGVDNWPHLPPPSTLRTNLPQELDGLLLRAMSFERTARPASCHDFEAACEAIIKRYGLTASDKDIARWVDSELQQLVPPFEGAATTPLRPSAR